ncbi:putative cytochrome P450 [Medicago truncatula]|uniref:Putative cytochrome P450 n=1 Tax=Medicago truncatula TaxID=3880 RepID=A0A396GI73_MEDTR|nr:cytochrome P450 71D11-like [Medicago truncatula]RHN40680.1 putative cytochrome P450 [Medicago truncatula]
MALQVLYVSLFFSFVLLALLVQKVGKKLKKTDTTFNLPKGPRKLPIIGNIHNLLSSLPHRKLSDLAKKYGPVMHLQLGEISTIVISSPEYAREVMKTHDINFATRPQILAIEILAYNSTNITFAPYGNYHRQVRKICTLELLSLKRVNSYQPIREDVLSNLVKLIASENGSPINLTEALFSSIYTIVSRAAFGSKCKGQEEFISVVKQTIKIAGGFNLGDLFPSAKWLQHVTRLRPKIERLHRQTAQILGNIIDEHKEARYGRLKDDEGEEDLVDVLLKYEDGSNKDFSLTKDNIKAIIMDIFGAGGDTSAITIDWAMAEMIREPRIMKKAQAEVREVFKLNGRVDENYISELNYLKSVVKETLRLHPPGPLLLPRECGKACEINGYNIPFKSKVIVNAWAIARDPNYWAEPERFYPERFTDSTIDSKGDNFEYIPFGAGRRICPGSIFGLRSVEVALAMLLYHFDWKLPCGIKSEELDMTEEFGVTMRRKDDLVLFPSVYHPLNSV